MLHKIVLERLAQEKQDLVVTCEGLLQGVKILW